MITSCYVFDVLFPIHSQSPCSNNQTGLSVPTWQRQQPPCSLVSLPLIQPALAGEHILYPGHCLVCDRHTLYVDPCPVPQAVVTYLNLAEISQRDGLKQKSVHLIKKSNPMFIILNQQPTYNDSYRISILNLISLQNEMMINTFVCHRIH